MIKKGKKTNKKVTQCCRQEVTGRRVRVMATENKSVRSQYDLEVKMRINSNKKPVT